MYKPTCAIKYYWQRLKAFASRLFAVAKIVLVAGFVALMLVVSNYTELREFVLSLLDEKSINFVKDTAKLLYGSPSVFFALEKTVIFIAMPASAILVRSVCTYAFISYVVHIVCRIVKAICTISQKATHAQPQRESATTVCNKWLTLCKFIS